MVGSENDRPEKQQQGSTRVYLQHIDKAAGSTAAQALFFTVANLCKVSLSDGCLSQMQMMQLQLVDRHAATPAPHSASADQELQA
jgi:hypothetical protein